MHPQEDLIVKEPCEGVLVGHFGINKNLEILKKHFYRPKIGRDVHKLIIRCVTCYMAKSHFHQGLYTPVTVPSRRWDDISIDFTVALA